MPEIKSLVTYGGHRAGRTYNVSKALADALVKMKRAQYLTKDMVSTPVPPVTPVVVPPPVEVIKETAPVPPPTEAVKEVAPPPPAPQNVKAASKPKKEDTKKEDTK